MDSLLPAVPIFSEWFLDVTLPYPLAVLVAFFVHVDSACNLLPYTAVAPLWTAPTAIPAWLMFISMWIYRTATGRRKVTGQSPSRP